MCFIFVAPVNFIFMRPLYEADVQCDCIINVDITIAILGLSRLIFRDSSLRTSRKLYVSTLPHFISVRICAPLELYFPENEQMACLDNFEVYSVILSQH